MTTENIIAALSVISIKENPNAYASPFERHISPDKTQEEIINAVLKVFKKVSYADLVSLSRVSTFVKPRHIAMYFVYNTGKYSLWQTAWIFGRTDHTTVIHALKKVDSSIRLYEKDRNDFNQVKALLL